MRLRVLVAAASLVGACAPGPAPATTGPTPEDQLERELVAGRRRPRAASSSAAAPWRPPSRASQPEEDPVHAACRSKIGASLASELAQRPPSDARPIPVSAEFHRPQEDDAHPGLRFVGPVVAIGELDPAAIAKLCESPELKWIEAAPKSFLSR